LAASDACSNEPVCADRPKASVQIGHGAYPRLSVLDSARSLTQPHGNSALALAA